jgi:hypothetical protein
MPDYQKGKIYKVYCLTGGNEDVYYGSTVEALSVRMAKHREHYILWKKGKLAFTTSYILFDKFDVKNCIIELIENYPCNNVEELRKREGYYQLNNPCVNKCIAGRTQKECAEKFRREHKDDKKEYDEKYREKNKEKKIKNDKEYFEKNKVKNINCICGSLISKFNKSRHERSAKHIAFIESGKNLNE